MKITLRKLSTKDLATLAQRTINTSESGNYPVIDAHPLLAELKLKYADYDAVYTKMTFSGKGNDVANSDNERDLAYTTLKAFLNSYRKMLTLPNFQSAEDLYQIFKQFGLNLDRMSYSSQTAQLKKLIEEKVTGLRIIYHPKQQAPDICGGGEGTACRRPGECNRMLCSKCPVAEKFFADRDGVTLVYAAAPANNQ